MERYVLHGIFMLLAFLVVFPLGALVAVFRHSIGPGWKTVHVALQLFGAGLVFIAAGLMAWRPNKKESSKPVPTFHRALGKTVVVLIVVQLLWAFMGRRLVDWTVWLWIHGLLSAAILITGWTNVYLAYQMFKPSSPSPQSPQSPLQPPAPPQSRPAENPSRTDTETAATDTSLGY
jgi:hypothetical protein